VQAAVEGSYARALEALAVHPLVGSEPLAKAILDGYLDAHGDLLSHIRVGKTERNPPPGLTVSMSVARTAG
jgi:hypothetical protein